MRKLKPLPKVLGSNKWLFSEWNFNIQFKKRYENSLYQIIQNFEENTEKDKINKFLNNNYFECTKPFEVIKCQLYSFICGERRKSIFGNSFKDK
jgi:hypothetical protein